MPYIEFVHANAHNQTEGIQMQQQLPGNYSATFLYPASQRRGIARTQQRDYSGKPWTAGLPTHDILGNALCFTDEPGNMGARYWVVGVTPSGAHIRKGAYENFSAYAPTEADALEIGSKHAERIAGQRTFLPMPTRQNGGFFIIEFRGTTRSLD